MIILKEVKNFIQDNLFKMIVTESTIYINSFKKMNTLEENHISFTTTNKIIHIYGKDLRMKKLVNQEALFSGTIDKVEVQHAK